MRRSTLACVSKGTRARTPRMDAATRRRRHLTIDRSSDPIRSAQRLSSLQSRRERNTQKTSGRRTDETVTLWLSFIGQGTSTSFLFCQRSLISLMEIQPVNAFSGPHAQVVSFSVPFSKRPFSVRVVIVSPLFVGQYAKCVAVLKT